MEVHHTLICVLFLTLRDGNTDLISAETTRRQTEGGNITFGCSFSFSGSRKLFCRNECGKGDVIIETTDDRAQSGRYSLKYKEGFFPEKPTMVYLTITQLKKSDSGWYMCTLARNLFLPDSHETFELIVTDAPTTSTPDVSLGPLSTSTPATTQSLSSSSGRFSPSPASTEATKQPEVTSSAGSGVLLYVGLSLVITVILLSLGVLILCRERAAKTKEGAAETVYADVTETHLVYEEIDEERRQSSSPVYTCAKYTKPNEQTTDEYSLVTATCAQSQTEEDSSKLVYSELDFPKGAAPALGGAPCVNADKVVYSVPR